MTQEPEYFLTRRIFLGGLGLVYLVAFLSLWVQIDGLVGPGGILPAQDFLRLARERLGGRALYLFPTLSWLLGAGKGALHFLCGAGTLSSLLLIAGILPAAAAISCWIFYLSLYTLCRDFLGFQWDILLLESGFLALWLASPFQTLCRRGRPEPAPSLLAVWLLRWLLFRFMFSSGAVKLSSGDPAWRDLSALAFHYETTCLPTWTGWSAHQFPQILHKISAAFMFAIELVFPFFIFGPRALRRVAAAGFVLLQIAIAATGNYGFFNLLTVVLCVPLLDDLDFPKLLRERLSPVALEAGRKDLTARPWPRRLLAPVATFLFLLSLPPLARAFRPSIAWPEIWQDAQEALQPFHLASSYGLFAVMTTERPEIVIEGSRDAKEWLAYEFKYKPGDPNGRPGFVQPHMPRLDWLMWFAALGSARGSRWFIPFCRELLRGSPDVLDLMGNNPFPEGPPKYLRATLYDYHFATPAERKESGAWWRRDNPRPYILEVFIPEGRPDRLEIRPQEDGAGPTK